MSEGPVKNGSETSEYKVTKWTIILSVIAALVGIVQANLPSIIEKLPEGGKAAAAGGVILAIAGVVGSVLATLGYNAGRVKLKAPLTAITQDALRLQIANLEATKAKTQADALRSAGKEGG
jgi:hypothetical protein